MVDFRGGRDLLFSEIDGGKISAFPTRRLLKKGCPQLSAWVFVALIKFAGLVGGKYLTHFELRL